MTRRIRNNVTVVAAIVVAAFVIAMLVPVGKVNAYACSLCDEYFAGELSDEEILERLCDCDRGVIPMVIGGIDCMEPIQIYREPIPVEIVVSSTEADGTFKGFVGDEKSYGYGQMPEILEGYGPGYGTLSDTVYVRKIVTFYGPCGPQTDWKLLPVTFDDEGVSEQIIYLYTDTIHGTKEEVVRRYDSKSGTETFRYRITAL